MSGIPARPNASHSVRTNCDDAQMFSLGYIHNLSKRTAVYTTVALIDNDDRAAITHTPSKTPQGFGEDSTAFEVGIRHAF